MSKPHRLIHVNDCTSILEIDGLTYVIDRHAGPYQTTEWLHKHYRTQAFGAIRRAAELARKQERSGYLREWEGEVMRRAIRAAIGSEKAT